MGIIARGVFKHVGEPPVRIIDNVSLEIRDGEFVSLTGRSGSGKSTLLYLLSSLDSVSSGVVELSGQDLSQIRPEELNRFRNEKMGFVFQFHYLIAELTAFENVLFPARRSGQGEVRKQRAKELLDAFGLDNKHDRLPRQLSGGEQQRVAIARALIMEPQYLFADEPTGALDSASGESVMQILREANTKLGTTLIMVTHDPDFAALAGRQIHLADGHVVEQSPQDNS
jgi:putative ABC transport system ATP-binding protein/lipoprotein-releasing system ATP-binding protein